MDKYEYNLKLEEIDKLVDQEDYQEAANLADTIDWRRVRNIRTLCLISEIYEAAGRLEESKTLLLRAYRRSPVGRTVLYRLVEVTTALGQFDEALEYYTEYVQAAPHDNNRYILKYKIYKGRGSQTQELIAILEEYLGQEYTERWAYELATLYQQSGQMQKCLAACDDLVLWFHSGKYVAKALELKKRYAALTPKQKQIYEECLQKKMADPVDETEEKETVVQNVEPDTGAAGGEFMAESIMAQTEREIANQVAAHKAEKDKKEEQLAAVEEPGERLASTRIMPGKTDTQVWRGVKPEHESLKAKQPEEAALEEQTAQPQAEEDDIPLEPGDLQVELAKSMRKILSGVVKNVEQPEDDIPASVDARMQNIQPLQIPETSEQPVAQLSIDDVLLSMSDKGKRITDAVLGEIDGEEPASQSGNFETEGAPKNRRSIERNGKSVADEAGGSQERLAADEGAGSEERLTSGEAAGSQERFASGEAAGIEERFASGEAAGNKERLAADEVAESLENVVADETPVRRERLVKKSRAQSRPEVEKPADRQEELAEKENTEKMPEETYERIAREISADGSDRNLENRTKKAGALRFPDAAKTMVDAAADELTDIQREALQYTNHPEKLLRNARSLPTYMEDEDELGKTRRIGSREELMEAAKKEILQEKTIRIPTDQIAQKLEEAAGKAQKAAQETDISGNRPYSEEAARSSDDRLYPEDMQRISDEMAYQEDTEDRSDELPYAENAEEYYDEAEPGYEDGEYLMIPQHLRGLFSGFTEVEGLEEQIANAIIQAESKGDDRTSRSGNILIFGAHGSGKTTLAMNIAKAIAHDKGNQTMKIAKIYATDLNRKDIAATVAKIAGGTLIVEEAGDLEPGTVEQLTTAMEFRTDGLVVILEDEQQYIHELLMRHPRFTMKFTAQIYIPEYTVEELAGFGQIYANAQDYMIGEEAQEILCQKLEEAMEGENPVTLADVIDLTGKAIARSNKFFRKLSMGKKRYDENDYIVLFPKDFK